MLSSRLFWKIFLVYAGLSFALAGAFLTVVSVWQKNQLIEQVEVQLHDTAIVLRRHFREPLRAVSSREQGDDARQQTLDELQLSVKRFASETNTRITLVAADGVVLADSNEDPSRMQNHSNREELIEAAGEKQFGMAERRSPTLGIRMLYLALPVKGDDGTTLALVRVAVPLESIDRQVGAIQRFLWLLACGFGLLALVLTYIIGARIVGPLASLTRGAEAIAQGSYDHVPEVAGRDELGKLSSAFQQMQRELSQRMKQLEARSAQLGTVLSSMSDGVMAVDAEQRMMLANDASREMLGVGMRDVVGRPLLEVARSRPIEKAVAKVFRTCEPARAEFEVALSDHRTLSLRATPLPGDPCPGVVIVLHDVTELRRLENLRSELVANVSHELKTPLASIRAYAETLRMGAVNDPENNLQFVGRIEEQAERLEQLIHDMLQLARVEAGEEVFDITDVPLAKIVRNSADHYADAAEAKRIALAIEPPARPLHVRADEKGMQTIVDNLLDNAIKYTPDGGRVTIRWRADDASGVLEVEDTGMGIDHADQPRVFERFFRVDKARSRELGGTGLGLAIVKHLTQSFGGSISLTSQPGQGTRLEIRLPLS